MTDQLFAPPPHLGAEWMCLTEGEQADVLHWAADLVTPALSAKLGAQVPQLMLDASGDGMRVVASALVNLAERCSPAEAIGVLRAATFAQELADDL